MSKSGRTNVMNAQRTEPPPMVDADEEQEKLRGHYSRRQENSDRRNRPSAIGIGQRLICSIVHNNLGYHDVPPV